MRWAYWLNTGWMLACGQAVAAPADYLDELIARARAENLASRREWLDLGHYRPGLLGSGPTSLIDSPGFFNAADGKVDPEAELEATLAAFFAGPAAGDQPQHPQCAFPARYHWLKSVLGFDPARLQEQACPRFADWLTPEDVATAIVTTLAAPRSMRTAIWTLWSMGQGS